MFFLQNRIAKIDFNREILLQFSLLDDTDLLAALKQWRNHSDFVLSKLCEMLLDRKLLHIKLKNKPFSPKKLDFRVALLKKRHGLTDVETSYFIFWYIFGRKYKNTNFRIIKENFNREFLTKKNSSRINGRSFYKL